MNAARKAGRDAGRRLVAHPGHELFDPVTPAELAACEKALGVALPDALRGLYDEGGGGVLEDGAILLGPIDPDELGSSLPAMALSLWEDGLPKTLLPLVDGERFLCVRLTGTPCEVLELDPESFEERASLGPLVTFVNDVLCRGKLPLVGA